MNLIVASGNKNKIKEIGSILKGLPIKVLSPVDLNVKLKIREDGKTFRVNALKKAKVYAKKFGMVALADDSGLMVDALSGSPGVRSARYAGPNPTKEKLCKKLLIEMKNIGSLKRKARFVCDIAVVLPEGKLYVVEGTCSGKIGYEMRGRYGFGYDPVFIPRGYKMTFAEMNPSKKNRISHRARALKKARILLKNILKRREKDG